MLTTVEFLKKLQVKQKLQKKYHTVAERVIAIALESVDFNEERAEQILTAVVQEEDTPKVTKTVKVKETRRPSPVNISKGVCISAEEQPSRPTPAPATRRIKIWTEHLKPILKTSITEESKHKSQYRLTSNGPNPSLRQGPKDSLLLEDYMAWNGPNPDLHCGQVVKPEGPEQRERKFVLARGPSGFAKGPAGIATGSIYHKLTKNLLKLLSNGSSIVL